MAPKQGIGAWVLRDTHWSRTGLLLAAVLTLLSPTLHRRLGTGAFSVFAQLPMYLAHQYEEHGHGAFKEYGNREILRRRGRLTDANIFVINIVGVWGVNLATLYVSRYRALAAGLLAPYLSIVNSLLHLGAALRTRRYNPGAWTAGLLLLPGGLAAVVVVTRTASTSARDHGRALGGAIMLHLIAVLIILSSGSRPEKEQLR